MLDLSLDTFKDEPLKRNILKIKSKEGLPSEEDIDTFVAVYEQVLEGGKDFVATYDIREYSLPPIGLAYTFGTKMKELQPQIDRSLKASVVILNSGFLTYMLTKLIDVFNSILPPPCPTTIVYTEEEAEAFLKEYYTAEEKEEKEEEEKAE
jgi:hypothetical protein